MLWTFQNILWKLCAFNQCAKSLQLCLTLCDPMDQSPPSFSVHGIHQARVLEWIAISGGTVAKIRKQMTILRNKKKATWDSWLK